MSTQVISTMSKPRTTPLLVVSWMCRIAAALILLQTLFFKFTAAPESVYIFTKVGAEPWGRIGSGIVELIAAILLLTPRFVWAARSWRLESWLVRLSATLLCSASKCRETKVSYSSSPSRCLLAALSLCSCIGRKSQRSEAGSEHDHAFVNQFCARCP